MQPRAALSNGIITLVALFFMVLLGMMLKARYRLAGATHAGDQRQGGATGKPLKAIPVAIPVQESVQEARAYKQGDWWVLPAPQLVETLAHEADTLRIKSGPKEDVFVLYFVDAAECSAARPGRVREQAAFFHGVAQEQIIEAGAQARDYVVELLSRFPFKVYTKWGHVPESERCYAFITVETKEGREEDLGLMLVRAGYATPMGQQTEPPPTLPRAEAYIAKLESELAAAKSEKAGLWALLP